MANNKLGLVLLLLGAMAVMARANIAEFDDYWRERESTARKLAEEAYHPEPEEVTDEINLHVTKALEGFNSTRRQLKKYTGPCDATNPIDRCWRCRRNWQKERKRLARCVKGFGRRTTGGLRGRFYVVTDPSDNNVASPKRGTLRHAVIQKGPLWIYFARDMVIRLKQELIVTSHKTIDGRGAQVHIAYGAGITIQYVHNVILHGLKIHDIVGAKGGLIRDSVDHVGFRTESDGDGISIFGSSNVWLDHLSMRSCQDGLIDVIMGSTAVTVSNSHFTHHNDVMLFGASDSYQGDKIMQVTVAFNHFGQGLVQRMPRCRWGFVHVVNNDYTHWLMYAIGGTSNPTIISQGNRFIAPNNAAAKEVIKRDYVSEDVWKNWTWRSEGDLMMNGAFFKSSGRRLARKFKKGDLIKPKPGTYAKRLTRFAGALNCRPRKPC
uniref:Pectate lyase n=1 Tax=Kalanchoe fedtschenkoi TaxID=63787 RepID=A0A7N0UZ31_KALFE